MPPPRRRRSKAAKSGQVDAVLVDQHGLDAAVGQERRLGKLGKRVVMHGSEPCAAARPDQ